MRRTNEGAFQKRLIRNELISKRPVFEEERDHTSESALIQ